jgi:hypothetical protein
MRDYSHCLVWLYHFHPSRYRGWAKLTLAMRSKWTSGWDSNWFYYKVPCGQLPDVWGKGSYPLRLTMTPLNYLSDVSFEWGPGDVNVGAFTVVASIIGGCDTVEEFLACGIWLLSEKCDFEVETKETPLLKVVVPMPRVTPVIGIKESRATFETWTIQAANLLVGNYNIAEHKAYTRLRHGWINRVFELVGLLCQPRLELVSCASRKRKVVATAQVPASKKATEKQKRAKGLSRSRDQTSAQELALSKPMKQSKKFISQSSGLSVTEKSSFVTIKISGGKTSSTSAAQGWHDPCSDTRIGFVQLRLICL